jgi:small-conductance mechanosensitive channel/CRP-like cAMP-binding protein
MLTLATLNAATWFAGAGLVLALATMALRRELRIPMATMIAVMVVGVLGLLLMLKVESSLPDAAVSALREVLLMLAAIGFARILVMFLFQALLARLAVPRILADVLFALLLVGYVLYRMNAVGVNLASIITLSTVISGAIAFSMQATLGNLWGGISLQLDNTCRLGDWIRLEGVSGQIVGIRWRYLAIATNNNETVMIPNSQLINNRVTVLGRRGDERVPLRRLVPFHVGYGTPPSRVIAAIQSAMRHLEIPNVAQQPAPICLCESFDDSGIKYTVRYWIIDLLRDEPTDSEVRVHLHAALAREGMEIPYPHRMMLYHTGPSSEERLTKEEAMRAEVLAKLPLFEAFTEGERRALASELVSCPYVTGDVISRLGESADSLYILASGSVAIFGAADAAGMRPKLAELAAADHFGEMGVLTGQARTATVVAQGDVLCYRLDKPGFDAILRARPALVDALSQVIATRQAANDKTLAVLSAEARARQASGRAADLVRKIRQFFDLG